MSEEIKLGKYKHYKGHIYQVIGVARNSEDLNQKLVIYTRTDENGIDDLWARPLEMFQENIDTDNYKGPRFEYLN
ncbi:MAG: DUF1653 domain-containing protein [Candidatus Nomurabacteria bacterium]|nr:DUF1653 domain-containing protein [Candidatus Nomurabacteria bacterium]